MSKSLRISVRRGIVSVAACGVFLIAISPSAWAASTPKNRVRLEAAACKLIRSVPTGGQTAIGVPKSTLAALTKSGNKSLESVVRTYNKAALAQNNNAMINALNNAVEVCHDLGLKTAA